MNDIQMPDGQEKVKDEKNLNECNTEVTKEIEMAEPIKKRKPKKKATRKKKKKSFWDLIWG